jgi:hypothetical protein
MEGNALNIRKPFAPTEPSDLEKEIARLFAKLAALPEDSDEYDRVSNQVKKLYPLKETDSKKQVSSDVLVGAAANLAGIVMILQYEHVHVITSKALGFIGKKIIG